MKYKTLLHSIQLFEFDWLFFCKTILQFNNWIQQEYDFQYESYAK